MALSKSLPTPSTSELSRVVTSEAVGAPEAALAPPTAPMAPEPLVPVVSTPAKLTTVMEETTLCERVAVTEMLFSTVGAKVRQISEVPFCTFTRFTRVQLRPPPVRLVTVVLVSREIICCNKGQQ